MVDLKMMLRVRTKACKGFKMSIKNSVLVSYIGLSVCFSLAW